VSVNGFDVTTADIEASNGVIHAIDGVLVPPQTLAEVTPAIVTGDIAIDGSSTVEPVTVAVADKFKTDGYSGNITVGESGTGGGFKAFCEDLTIDIADASRAIKTSGDAANPDELEKCQANNREPIGFRVGTDGLTIVVNPANEFATDLTSDEIVTLFSTAVKLSDVRADFPAEDIVRYIPGTDSGTYDYFVEVFFAKDGTAVQASSSLNQSENDNTLVQGVEGNQYAVGFFGYAYYQANTDKLTAVAIDGVLPTFDTVEGGTYKLSRPLYIYTTAAIMAEKPQVAEFISYYLQNLAEVIPTVGYFPASAQAENATDLLFLASAAPAA
jgi:phosphate transport system substrate-binding protein